MFLHVPVEALACIKELAVIRADAQLKRQPQMMQELEALESDTLTMIYNAMTEVLREVATDRLAALATTTAVVV